MAEYKSGPNKINLVSIIFFGGIAFAIYAAVRFLPPYWKKRPILNCRWTNRGLHLT